MYIVHLYDPMSLKRTHTHIYQKIEFGNVNTHKINTAPVIVCIHVYSQIQIIIIQYDIL